MLKAFLSVKSLIIRRALSRWQRSSMKSQPREARLRTLRELSVLVLARHLHCLEDVGDMDVENWKDIIRAAGPYQRATPTNVSRVEASSPHLVSEETDIFFWRPLVQQALKGGKSWGIEEPYPLTRDRVMRAVGTLEQWCVSPGSSPLPAESLNVLDEVVITVKLLADTRAGHVLKSLRRAKDHLTPATFRQAEAIGDRWKAYHRSLTAPGEDQSSAGAAVKKISKRSGKGQREAPSSPKKATLVRACASIRGNGTTEIQACWHTEAGRSGCVGHASAWRKHTLL